MADTPSSRIPSRCCAGPGTDNRYCTNGVLDPDGAHLNRLWYVYDDSSRVTTADALLEGRLQTGGVQHTLLFGIDGLLQDASQTTAQGLGTPLNVYSPVYGGFPRPSITTETPVENEIRRIGVLAQNQMRIAERLSVRVGLRRDMVRNAVIGGDTEKDWATSANVGVVYQVLPGWRRTRATRNRSTRCPASMPAAEVTNRSKRSRSKAASNGNRSSCRCKRRWPITHSKKRIASRTT